MEWISAIIGWFTKLFRWGSGDGKVDVSSVIGAYERLSKQTEDMWVNEREWAKKEIDGLRKEITEIHRQSRKDAREFSRTNIDQYERIHKLETHVKNCDEELRNVHDILNDSWPDDAGESELLSTLRSLRAAGHRVSVREVSMILRRVKDKRRAIETMEMPKLPPKSEHS